MSGRLTSRATVAVLVARDGLWSFGDVECAGLVVVVSLTNDAVFF